MEMYTKIENSSFQKTWEDKFTFSPHCYWDCSSSALPPPKTFATSSSTVIRVFLPLTLSTLLLLEQTRPTSDALGPTARKGAMGLFSETKPYRNFYRNLWKPNSQSCQSPHRNPPWYPPNPLLSPQLHHLFPHPSPSCPPTWPCLGAPSAWKLDSFTQ